jgi:hypothetical protein
MSGVTVRRVLRLALPAAGIDPTLSRFAGRPFGRPFFVQGMIRKSGNRFSEKIMLKQNS